MKQKVFFYFPGKPEYWNKTIEKISFRFFSKWKVEDNQNPIHKKLCFVLFSFLFKKEK